MKIREWLDESARKLESAGIKSARLDCLLILEFCIEKPREWILAHEDEELDAATAAKLNNMIARRVSREPLAYITGSKEFYGRAFKVTPEVLIPRPESEDMINLLFAFAGKHDINTVIDIGTGSGILAITAKLELPHAYLVASDTSSEALEVAKVNARDLGADIHFHMSDLLTRLPDISSTQPYVVLANLPYVPRELVTSEEITKEPALALFSGDDGLNHYKQLWQQIGNLNNKPFCVITEGLSAQHTQLEAFAQNAGYQLDQTATLVQRFILRNEPR